LLRDNIRRTLQESIYRYAPLLPIRDSNNVVTLGEGGTPLVPMTSLGQLIGTPRLLGKDETRNPTQSFKDRPISVGISVLRELCATDVACISAGGNTASSVAAYCARAQIKAHLYLPSWTPRAKLLHALALGAEVKRIEGADNLSSFNFGMSEMRRKGFLPLMTRPKINPFPLEGCKTIAYELVEQLKGDAPDWVVIAVGTGTNLAGVWKGFKELHDCGLAEQLPRLLATQSNTCMPLVDAFERGLDAEEIVPWPDAHTIASGLNDAYPDACVTALQALKDSHGKAISVTDQGILEAVLLLARQEGLFAEPAGAASIAGLIEAIREGIIKKDDRVVCLITGSGLKQPDALTDFIKVPKPIRGASRNNSPTFHD
jgi:threonine synthase